MSKQAENKLRNYYNKHVKEEDARLDEHPFEITVTLHFVNKYLKPGNDRFVEATEWFTNAYFAHPEEVNSLVEQVGLEPLHLAMVNQSKHLLSVARKPD